MEQVLCKYLDELLILASDLGEHYYYESIFRDPNGIGSHRNLYPYWACEFQDPSKLEVRIGLCYLVAMHADKIPFKNAVEESLDYITEVDGFQITTEQLEVVLENIMKIYPQFKASI